MVWPTAPTKGCGYKWPICRGGWPAAPKKTICRDSEVGEASQTAPTNHLKQPLQRFSVVAYYYMKRTLDLVRLGMLYEKKWS